VNYVIEFGDEVASVRDVNSSGSAALIVSPFAIEDVFSLQYVQLNDVMFFAHPNYMPQRLTFDGASFAFDVVPFEFAPYLDLNESRIAVQVQYTGIRKWANSWVTATAYKAGDIIQGTGATAGRIYTCIADHTSAALTQPGVGANSATVWTQIATGYVVGDRVLGLTAPYEGQIFTCHTAHGGATADAVDEPGAGSSWESYWNLGTSSVTIAAWAAGTTYSATNKVRYNSVIYECRQSHVASAPINGRYGKSGGNRPSDGQAWTSFWKISSAGNDLSGLAFNLVATEDLFTSSDVGTNWLLELGTTGRYDSISLSGAVGAYGPTEPLFIQGSFLVTTIWTAANSFGGTLYLEESLDGVTWSKIKDWNQTDANDGNISYDGTAPDVGAWYRIGGLKTTARGNGQMKIEAVSAVIKMPFLIESYTSATVVGGKLITVNDQLPPAAAIGVSTTNYRKPAFSPTEGYPRAVCFHDGRIWFAGTTQKPTRIWGSKLDDFYNFLTGSLDDSGLDLTLAATEANRILWMASHNRAMVVGRSNDEWTIDGGDAETVITPTKARARSRTKHGSAEIAPELIAESLLWVTREGSQVREFTYSFQIDGFTAPDMTQLIGKLQGRIIQTAYQTDPVITLWAVTDIGKLYSFTYDREQNITAWAEHSTGEDEGDLFESVAVTHGDVCDEVWFIVKRENNGATVRFLERFHPETFEWIMSEYQSDDAELCWLDCAKQFTWNNYMGGPPPSAPVMYNLSGDLIVLGLTQLKLRSVSTLVNWEHPAASAAVTAGGLVTLLDFIGVAGSWWVGLLVNSKLQSFPLEAALQDGTGQGRHWRPNRIVFLLHDSMGGTYGDTTADAGYAVTYPSDATYPFRGRIAEHLSSDWRDTTEVTVKHSDPVPFGLLGYVLKGEISGS
jgi:hypothetical protein